jgi:hypothetical protein
VRLRTLKRLLPSLFAAALLAGQGLGTTSCGALELGSDELRQLKAREAVVRVVSDESGEADGRIDAVIDVAAAPATVWAVMLDCDRALAFVKGLRSCSVVERAADGSWDVREHRTKWLAIMPELRSVFRSDYVREKSIHFTRTGGDLKFLEGDWVLEPLNGARATRLYYHARVSVSVPLPGFMLRAALEEDVPERLKSLRAEAERTK